MKRFRLAAVILLLTGGALVFSYRELRPVPSPAEPITASSSAASASLRAGAATKTATLEASPATEANSLASRAGELKINNDLPTNLPPEIVLRNLCHAVHQYGQMFGGNPVGTNPEITAALTGNNPKQINFLSGEAGMHVDGNGELIDTWGTPYFFHQLSGTVMEIHSAGPDKIMWTSDDLVSE
jgi:hypothetical protein